MATLRCGAVALFGAIRHDARNDGGFSAIRKCYLGERPKMTASPKQVLILGNLGYIGPVVGAHLRQVFPNARLTGYDTAYFQSCLIDPYASAEHYLDEQLYGDLREEKGDCLKDVDCVVALAAISNDPMGNLYEKPTREINTDAIVALAEKAKKAGVKHFVFASSCSVYGAGGDAAKTEEAELNPLTAYARSKIACEQGLLKLADKDFIVTCLRFATACGYSPRLRLDLVLNDFVASAYLEKRITILSDGTPWRPLIAVSDMARAIEWAATRDVGNGSAFLAINTGSDSWNYQVKDLAAAVGKQLGGVEVSINQDAAPDKRSYRVDFSLFRKLAPHHQPLKTLPQVIQELIDGFKSGSFAQADFRKSHLIRLNTLSELKQRGEIDGDLYWTT
jgi:nucleoside-diphosphate-sugar epimerase